jgi:probable F420-dependent oxidoreductase
MRIGAIFPHDTIEPEAGAIRAWTLAVEEMGFNHILTYDHVIGANRASRPDWQGYDLDSKFHEPVTLLSWIAALTSTVGLATGVMILPQRQTVLVAKQASTLDLLCGGRLRLGVGTGWNQVEYEALGVDFATRGKIFDEQIDVLRALWSDRAVSFNLPHHRITDAGIFPMPLQRPIPLWLGGGGVHPIKGWANVETVIRRIARKADGWLPTFEPDDTGAELVGRFRDHCREYGRDPDAIGIEALLLPSIHADWAAHVRGWEKLGATQMCVNVAGQGIEGVEGNLRRLEEVRGELLSAGLWTNVLERAA